MAEVTTMKISTATRDRLKALGREGDSLEDVVVAALDLYESEQFWAQADASVRAEDDAARRARRARRRDEAAVDVWMQRLR